MTISGTCERRYAQVDDATYAAGRIAILRALLARPTILLNPAWAACASPVRARGKPRR